LHPNIGYRDDPAIERVESDLPRKEGYEWVDLRLRRIFSSIGSRLAFIGIATTYTCLRGLR